MHSQLYKNKMGCSPDKERNSIIQVKPERMSSGRGTGSSVQEDKNQYSGFQQINISLFMIREENSKFEESAKTSKIGANLTPQRTENFKDAC